MSTPLPPLPTAARAAGPGLLARWQAAAAALFPPPGQPLRRRPWLWVLLVCLLLVAQTALVWLTFDYESKRLQEGVDTASANIVADIRQAVAHDLQNLQALSWREDRPALQSRAAGAHQLLGERRELLRIERRDPDMLVIEAIDSPYRPPIFTRLPRAAIQQETEIACAAAARTGAPVFSRSYFVPLPGDLGLEIADICLPEQRGGSSNGFITASIALPALLEEVVAPELLQAHELSFINGDGSRLARAGRPRGAGIYVSERLIDLPGQTMRLRVDSSAGHPRLIPNLAVALVLGLSLALGAVVVLLARDMRRRSIAEHALAEALAFRKAMEDSLLTGLRARDIDGRVTYVNPAFCEMVGFSAAEIIGQDPPPYWPPEKVPEYRSRLQQRQSSPDDPGPRRGPSPRGNLREGFETTFLRKDGERFAVLIFDAPLVDSQGRQTGWMSAALDVSDQRRIEELARQQQERLQATARLATVGEMASLLSHELNQPLAAISSYAAGSLNLLGEPTLPADSVEMLRQAIERIATQAERAGKVIKSVHDFVRRRQQLREPVGVEALIDAVLPLIRLQARKSGARIEVSLEAGLPRVVCDRTMVEQVLLNLTRNGIQAMEEATPLERRELSIRIRASQPNRVLFSVVDRGPGIPDAVAQRLFTPFFTTRSEGMGLGLSLCRTVIEQHGGALDYEHEPACRGAAGEVGPATVFRFTLPAERLADPLRREEAAQSA